MGRDEFVTEFLERGLLGFYLAVAREGEVEAGDPIVELSRDPRGFGVTEVARLYAARPRRRRGHAAGSRARRASGELARLLPEALRTRRRSLPRRGVVVGSPAVAGKPEWGTRPCTGSSRSAARSSGGATRHSSHSVTTRARHGARSPIRACRSSATGRRSGGTPLEAATLPGPTHRNVPRQCRITTPMSSTLLDVGAECLREADAEALIAEAAAGCDQALAGLYDLYGRRAYGLALRVLRDEMLAEDAVQDAFPHRMAQRSKLPPRVPRHPEHVGSITIVHRRAVDIVRREQRRRAHRVEENEEPTGDASEETVLARAEGERVRRRSRTCSRAAPGSSSSPTTAASLSPRSPSSSSCRSARSRAARSRRSPGYARCWRSKQRYRLGVRGARMKTQAAAGEHTEVDETALVEALRQGDRDAFATVVDANNPWMMRIALSHVSSRASAEDAVQDAWLRCLRGLDGFEGRSALKSWLFVIVTNCARRRAERDSRSVPSRSWRGAKRNASSRSRSKTGSSTTRTRAGRAAGRRSRSDGGAAGAAAAGRRGLREDRVGRGTAPRRPACRLPASGRRGLELRGRRSRSRDRRSEPTSASPPGRHAIRPTSRTTWSGATRREQPADHVLP